MKYNGQKTVHIYNFSNQFEYRSEFMKITLSRSGPILVVISVPHTPLPRPILYGPNSLL